MHLLNLGIDHHRARLDARSALAFDAERAAAMQARLCAQPWVEEALVLSTCNRTELYVATREAVDKALVLATWLGDLPEAPPPDADCYVIRTAEHAARHLLRVAAGLESAIVGETEIQGQVRTAHERARRDGAVGPVLDRLLTTALRTGKRARSETGISAGGASHGSAAVRVVRNVFGTLRKRRVLIVGAGEMATQTARALEPLEAEATTVLNRTGARAETLANNLARASVAPPAELDVLLPDAHVVVVAARLPEPLSASRLAASLAKRREPLVVIDLGLPRGVDAAARDLTGVFLYDLEDLERLVADALAARRDAVPAVEAIVHAEWESFRDWLRAQHVLPAIRSMHEWAAALRDEELAHLPADLSPEARAAVERLSERLIRRLLGRAASRVVQGARQADPSLPTAQQLRTLFGLDEGDEA